MSKILDRENNEIKIIIYDEKQNCKELTRNELDYIYCRDAPSANKHTIGWIIKTGAAKCDYSYFVLLAKFLARRLISVDSANEPRKALSNKIISDIRSDILIANPSYSTLDAFRKMKYMNIIYKGKVTKLVHTRENLFDVDSNTFWMMLFEIFITNQYDVHEKNIKGKVVIDAGANIGMFALYVASLGAKKVYAFEPVTGTYEILKKNIELNNMQKIIIPVNMALGDKKGEGEISFSEGGDVGASIALNSKAKNKQKIQITMIDDYFKIEHIDFLKMDTEGYEENVLIGGKQTIKRCKPILSFSAYHKPTDKTRLPEVVRSIRSDYNIKLNHYDEEDFYCD